ncbi:hypothetical protein BGX31_002632 [Mortierella sp. GBA43]|nr:hypothetical protein BGX31_002632 [Mortierella sp. GBA43]
MEKHEQAPPLETLYAKAVELAKDHPHFVGAGRHLRPIPNLISILAKDTKGQAVAMTTESRFQFFLKSVPDWPIAGGTVDALSASNWINELGDLIIDCTPAEKFAAAEMKMKGPTKAWMKRWKRNHAVTSRHWGQFAADFVAEVIKDRDAETTWDEIAQFRQEFDEPTASYIQRALLTVDMLPKSDPPAEVVYEYGIDAAEEKRVAYYLCRGLRNDHLFKRQEDKVPDKHQGRQMGQC